MRDLTFDDFAPVTLDDRLFFSRHYKRYPQVHSDNTFTNMVCWNHYANYRYAFLREAVIISSTIDGKTRFRLPIGPRDPALVKSVLRLAFETGDSEPIVLIDRDSAVFLHTLCPALNIVADRDHFEYIYASGDLARLPGGRYLAIRRQLNRFRKNCAYSVEPITPENRREVKEFLIKWCEWKGCEGEPVLAHEKEAVFFAIDHFPQLDANGLLIRVNNAIAAMAVYEPLGQDTAVVHFEKGLLDCVGIYKAINAETAAVLTQKFPFINRESDLGVRGLREAKLRYHPHHMVEVFSVRKDGNISP